MKKLIMIGIAFLFMFLNLNINASSYSFKWENTYISIPLGSSLKDYINLPRAVLCIDGVETDHEVYYLTGDQSTCEENINTSKIGIYYLAYWAISDIEDKALVTFEVYDNRAPTIELIGDLVFSVGFRPDYSKYFVINDNYSKTNVIYNDDDVKYSIPGNYKLYVSATDEDGNSTNREYIVSIKDDSPPKIEVIKDLIIEVNSTFNHLEYFKAYDDINGDVSKDIKCSDFDINLVGTKSIVVEVSDGVNSVTNEFNIVVVDNTCPYLSLVSDRISITIGEIYDLNRDFFLNNIYELYDNYDELKPKEVIIDYTSVKPIIGEYEVIYTINDSSDNSFKKIMFIDVLCDSVPEITTSVIKVKTGSKINYNDYVSAYDKYDGDLSSEIEIDSSNVNINKKGVYFVPVKVKNANNKYNYSTIVVYVEEEFVKSYYWLFFIPVGLTGVIIFFIIKKKKSVL